MVLNIFSVIQNQYPFLDIYIIMTYIILLIFMYRFNYNTSIRQLFTVPWIRLQYIILYKGNTRIAAVFHVTQLPTTTQDTITQ